MKKTWIAIGVVLIIFISIINYNIYEDINSSLVEENIKKLDESYYKYYKKDPPKINSKNLSLKELYNKKSDQYLALLTKDIVAIDNDIKFYRLENTEAFLKNNRSGYSKTLESIKESYASLLDSVKGHDYTSSINQLINLKSEIDELKSIIKDELVRNKEVMNTYHEAEANKIGANELEDDCFEKQKIDWDFKEKISQKYCEALDLKDCNNKFIGYTMNNPQSVNKKLPYYSYVSFSDSHFKKDILDFSKYQKEYRFVVEVYAKEINNRTIYKYNVIGIPLNYKLSCQKPNK